MDAKCKPSFGHETIQLWTGNHLNTDYFGVYNIDECSSLGRIETVNDTSHKSFM